MTMLEIPSHFDESNNARTDIDAEDRFWRENYSERPYIGSATYDDFGPAYAYGVNSYHSHREHARSFDDIEDEMAHGWDAVKGSSRLTWERAKEAARDAWDRLTRRA